jgi:molecular chaperone DnaJ
VTAAASHYATLGVAPDASAAEIRDAYRALARRHHPDRGPVDAGAMAAINEAYRVLGEPARRAVYDASRRGTGSAATGGGHGAVRTMPAYTVVAPESPPARYPWKLVIGMFLVGAAVVLLGVALYEPAEPAPPDNLLAPGSCVVIEANGDAREINCTDGSDELVVEALVGMDARCPVGTVGHRDRQGRGLACVTAPSVP